MDEVKGSTESKNVYENRYFDHFTWFPNFLTHEIKSRFPFHKHKDMAHGYCIISDTFAVAFQGSDGMEQITDTSFQQL